MTVPANAYKAIEQETIGFNNTNPLEANFEVKCTAIVLRSTAAVHVAFDETANTSSFLLPADTAIEFHPPFEYTRVSALGNAGSGTLYIIGRR